MRSFGLTSMLGRLAPAGLASIAAICSMPAQASCIEPSDAADLVSAKTAIASWEESRGVHVAPEQRSAILEEYCAAAKIVVDELGVALADVTTGAREPLWTYLDASASSEVKIQTIDALVQAQYALHGSARLPEIKPMGVVRVIYRRAADALTVNGIKMEPFPKFFAKIGSLSIAGLSRGNVVCSATLTVSAVRPAEFLC